MFALVFALDKRKLGGFWISYNACTITQERKLSQVKNHYKCGTYNTYDNYIFTE